MGQCQSCGAELTEGTDSCASCGQPVPAVKRGLFFPVQRTTFADWARWSTLQSALAVTMIGLVLVGGYLGKVFGGHDPVGMLGILMILVAIAVTAFGGRLFLHKEPQEPSSPPAPAAPETERPTQSLAPSDAQAATPPTPTAARSFESAPPDVLQDQPSVTPADESWAAPEPPEPPQAPSLS